MYKLIIWKAIWTESGPETGTDSYILNYKPTFEDMYKHLSTDMIEITKGYEQNITHKSFDMYIDEESKLKPVIVKNNKAKQPSYPLHKKQQNTYTPQLTTIHAIK